MTSTQPTTAITTENPASTILPTHLRRIVLTGFMGAGKSTIGRLLAARLSWDFLDLDAHLESRANATIPELFERHGEARFRRLESSALASALGRSKTVLALGGGTPEELTNRLLLEQTPGTFTIFLDAPFPVLFDRCMLQEIARPVLADPAEAELRFARRQPLYRRLANLTVDTSDLTSDQTVQTILTAISRNSEPHSVLPPKAYPEQTICISP
jgi:shikimate kinase